MTHHPAPYSVISLVSFAVCGCGQIQASVVVLGLAWGWLGIFWAYATRSPTFQRRHTAPPPLLATQPGLGTFSDLCVSDLNAPQSLPAVCSMASGWNRCNS